MSTRKSAIKLLSILSVLVIASALSGCDGWPPNPQPTPTPEPTPTPTPWECQLEMPRCDLVEPPQQCSSVESPCWHNPTQDPHHCEEAPKCEEPPPPELPQPQCETFTDRGGTFRTLRESCDCYFGQTWKPCAEPGPCCFPPHEPGHHWKARTPGEFPTEYYNEYRHAVAEVGDRCGEEPKETLALIADALVRQGVCASGPEADSVSIKRASDGRFEEWHAVYYGNGCIIDGPNAYKAAWEYSGPACQSPTPTPTPPPPSGECPEPHPDLTKMKFTTHEKNSHLDTTWTTNYQCEFCEEIGLGEHGGQPRCGCPVRPECGPDDPPDYICHDRAVCEAELCDQKWKCNGEPYPPYRGNPAQTDCRGHWETWCDAPGSTARAEGHR
jgi:hypothetical protein